jgi:serine/threonine protein kinase
MVHRDIKPSNVLIHGAGEPLLAWGGESRPEENALVVVAIYVPLMSPFALTVNRSLYREAVVLRSPDI